MWKSIALLYIAGLLIASPVIGEEFIIGAWGPPDYFDSDTLYLNQVDSAGFNTIKITTRGWRYQPELFFQKTEDLNMEIVYDNLSAKANYYMGLSEIAHGQHSVYESESTCFEHETGSRVSDPDASNSYAWMASPDAGHSPGWLQYGLNTNEQDIVAPRIGYFASFRLKIADTTGVDTVCRLQITTKDSIGGMDSVIVDTLLYTSDFTAPNLYRDFTLYFHSDTVRGYNGLLDYRIYWYGNKTVWADKVDIRDSLYYNLLGDVYDGHIENIVIKYKPYPSLYRYYLKDQPSWDQFDSYEAIEDRLILFGATKPAIVCIWEDKDERVLDTYQEFVNRCNPNEILHNFYPLFPDIAYSGSDLQQYSFPRLRLRLKEANYVAKKAGIPVWFIVQAHSWKQRPDTVSSWKEYLREPTATEIKCMTYMALAHGVKGIFYYLYASRITETIQGKGLVDHDGDTWLPNYKWYVVQEINQKLKTLGPILLTLDHKDAFPTDSIPSSSYIKSITPDTMEVGTFKDSLLNDYFILVNRICNQPTDSTVPAESVPPADTQDVNITIDYTKPGKWGLKDMYTGEVIEPVMDTLLDYTVRIGPGEGRLFQIVDIDPPGINLLNPTGGEKWEIGGLHRIRWGASDNVGVELIRVILYTEGAKAPGGSSPDPWWDTLAVLPSDVTYYDWEIPNIVCSNCKIIVVAEDKAGNQKADVSGWFEIGPLFSTTGLATAHNNQRKLGLGGSSEMYMVYQSSGRVLFDYSSDNGVSWAQEYIGDGGFPALAIDGASGINVLWVKELTENKSYKLYFRRKTTAWCDTVELFYWPEFPYWGFRNFFLYPPSIVIDETDTCHIVIETFSEAYENPNYTGWYSWRWELRYGKFSILSPDSVIWEIVDTCFISGTLPPSHHWEEAQHSYLCSSIDIDASGHPHIAWTRPHWRETGEVYYIRKTDTGWSSTLHISETPDTSSTNPFVDIHNGRVSIVWDEDGEIMMREGDLSTGMVEPAVNISNSPLHSTSPQILDGVVIVWEEEDGEIYRSIRTRTGWDVGLNISNTIYNSKYPQIAYERISIDGGRLFCAWTDGNLSPYEVKTKTEIITLPVGNIIQEVDNISALAENNANRLVQDNNGNLHLVYTSGDSVWHIKSSDGGGSWNMPEGISRGTHPAIVVNSNNEIGICWWAEDEKAILYRRFDGVWSDIDTLLLNAVLPTGWVKLSLPSITIDGKDTCHMVAKKTRYCPISLPTYTQWICYVKFPFSTPSERTVDTIGYWTTAHPILFSPCIVTEPSTNILHAIWGQGMADEGIYYRRCVSGVWDDTTIHLGPGIQPTAGISGNVIHLAWQKETTSGLFEIYHTARYLDGGEMTPPTKVASGKSPFIDGNFLVFENNGEIYQSEWVDFKWTTPPMNISNTEFSVSQSSQLLYSTWAPVGGPTPLHAHLYKIWLERWSPYAGIRWESEQVDYQPRLIMKGGTPEPSPWTVKRDTFIVYGDEPYQSVDMSLAASEAKLSYLIPGLDTTKKNEILIVFYPESEPWELEIELADILDEEIEIPAYERFEFRTMLDLSELEDEVYAEVEEGELTIEQQTIFDSLVQSLVTTRTTAEIEIEVEIDEEAGGDDGGPQTAEESLVFALHQNYPNPFRKETVIKFTVKGSQFTGKNRQLLTVNCQLKIYDVTGRVVQTLVDERLKAGHHTVRFDGRNLASGVYFARLKAGNYTETRKMILLR